MKLEKQYDVYAIGNALVDYEIEISDQFLSDWEIEKSLMTLVDENRQKNILKNCSHAIKHRGGGGSAANTIFTLSQFGGKGCYGFRVADDMDGNFFLKEIKKQSISTHIQAEKLTSGSTGKCLVMVTPDAKRTMNTFLGVSQDFSKEDIDPDAIRNSNYLFMEGFLVASSQGINAMKYAMDVAVQNEVKVSLTFSDPSTVKYFYNQFVEITKNSIDLLFCNIEEAMLFAKTDSLKDIVKRLSQIAKSFVITKGEEGATLFHKDNLVDIKSVPTTPVDTTGAGDTFAGAYLYGINAGYSFKDAGKLAAAAGSIVVSQFGSRLSNQQIPSILSQVIDP